MRSTPLSAPASSIVAVILAFLSNPAWCAPYFTVTDLEPALKSLSSTCNTLHPSTQINNNNTISGNRSIAQCTGSIYSSAGYSIRLDSVESPSYFYWNAEVLNDNGKVAGTNLGPYPDFSSVVHIGNSDAATLYYVPNVHLSVAALNNNDQAVGVGVDRATNVRSTAVYEGGQVRYLGTLSGATYVEPLGISDSGKVVGWATAATGIKAVAHNRREWIDLSALLGSLMGTESRAVGVNNLDQVIGYSVFGDKHIAWIIDETQASEIPPPFAVIPADRAYVLPKAVNNLGVVVGSAGSSSFADRPFIYAANQSYDLNALIDQGSGRHIRQVFDINDFGQIVGSVSGPDGADQSVLLSPTAENTLPRLPDLSLLRPPGDCAITSVPVSLPIGGGTVRLSVSCGSGGAPTRFEWTGAYADGQLPTGKASTGTVTQTTTFTVSGSNPVGISSTGAVTVNVDGGPPATNIGSLARVTPLDRAITVNVINANLGTSAPATIETEVRQGTLVEVLRAIVEPGGDTQHIHRNLLNGTPASVSVYSIDAEGNRSSPSAAISATPQPVPESATLLASATPPILLLHGYRADEGDWESTFKYLENAGFSVFRRSLDAGSDNLCQQAFSTPSLADWISEVKQRTGASRVILVGHSQGGIVGRLYLQAGASPTAFADALQPFTGSALEVHNLACVNHLDRSAAFRAGEVDVAKLVTYGTPHNGAKGVGNLSPLLREGAPFLEVLNRFSDFPIPDGVELTSLVGKTKPSSGDDCLVDIASQDMSKLSGSPSNIISTTVPYRKHGSIGGALLAACVSGLFRVKEIEDSASIASALKAQVMKISSLSPVDLMVTSPSGKVINRTRGEIWGATYDEFFDESGDKKNVVTIPFPERGAYQIKVTPDSTAKHTDTFSIVSEIDRVEQVLVDRALVGNAASSPYIVSRAIENRHPIANAGRDRLVEGDSFGGAHVQLDGSASIDPDGDALAYMWTGAFGSVTGVSPTLRLPFGANFITLTVADGKGGGGSVTMRISIVDKTPPVVIFSGNAGSYAVDQTVAISCAATDSGSGVASTTCKNVSAPAYSFPLGTNILSATATDKAGNVGTGSTTFTVNVTYQSLINLTKRFVTKPLVKATLVGKLKLAAAAQARGELKVKAKLIELYIAELKAATGKAIAAENAAILTKLAQAL